MKIFRANPGIVLHLLERHLSARVGKGHRVADDIAALEGRSSQLDNAEGITLRQLTRGFIDESRFDKEIESIKRDKAAVETELTKLRQLAADQDAHALALGRVRSGLEVLREKLDGNLTFEQERQIIEDLVESITVIPSRRGKPKIAVRYVFDSHAKRQMDLYRQTEQLAVLPEATGASSGGNRRSA